MIEQKDVANRTQIRVAFYVRVSTEEQVKSGFGLDMQIESLRKIVAAKNINGWIHKSEWEFIDEGCSGADLDRKEFKAMMEMVKAKKIDVVAVYKIDRVSRNLSHLLKVFEDLQKNGASFYSVKEDIDFSGPVGKLTFQIFGALAEFERDLIKTRTIEGKIASAHLGNYIGNGIPYGYKKVANNNSRGSRLEIVKPEAEIVKSIFKSFIYEGKNYEDIARELNDKKIGKGVASRTSKKLTKWYGPTVRDMLSNTTYSGNRIEKIKNGKDFEEISIKTPPIINNIMFMEAKLMMDRINETKGLKGGGINSYLLSRKIIDVVTNRKFVGVKRNDGRLSYRRKNFIDRTGIQHKNLEIPASEIDDIVWNTIKMAINKPDKFYRIYKMQNVEDRSIERYIESKDKLIIRQADIDNSITSIEMDYYDGKISDEKREGLLSRYNEILKSINLELVNIDKELNRLLQYKTSKETVDDFSVKFKNNVDSMDLESKQRLIDLMIDRIDYQETKQNRDINIVFRFATKIETDIDKKVEPENSQSKIKNTITISDNSVIGRGDRT